MIRLSPRARNLTPVAIALGCLVAKSAEADADKQAECGNPSDREPPVSLVVRAALHEAGLAREPTSDATARAKLSGLLPTIRFGIRRGVAQDSSLSSGTTDRTNLSRDDDLSLDGTLTFELGRVLFAREEIALLRERRAFELDRQALIEEVVRTYFERDRLRQELAESLGTAQDRARSRQHARAAQARLDLWTAGAFEACWLPIPTERPPQ